MISAEKQQVLELYNQGLQNYKLQKWDEAIGFFQKALDIMPDDGPSKLYKERCLEFKANPPGDDWDGVYTMKTK